MTIARILIIGCAVLLADASQAQAPQKAQTQAQQKAGNAPAVNAGGPSASALATAKEYLQIKKVSALYEGFVVSTIQNIKNSLIQSNLMHQRDLNEVAAKLAGELRSRENELIDGLAVVYARDFTEQELKDLITFYQSPLGKKVLEQDPKSVESSLNYLRNWGDDFTIEVNNRFVEEMKKRGKDL